MKQENQYKSHWTAFWVVFVVAVGIEIELGLAERMDLSVGKTICREVLTTMDEEEMVKDKCKDHSNWQKG